jgi:hypothetical protein
LVCMSGSVLPTTPEKNRTIHPVLIVAKCELHWDPGLIGTRLGGYEAMTCTSLGAGFSMTRRYSGLIARVSVNPMSGLRTTNGEFSICSMGFGGCSHLKVERQ